MGWVMGGYRGCMEPFLTFALARQGQGKGRQRGGSGTTPFSRGQGQLRLVGSDLYKEGDYLHNLRRSALYEGPYMLLMENLYKGRF